MILLFGFQGMKRLYADIHDINVDVPAAYTLLETLANKLHSKHVLGDSLMADLPSRYILHKCHLMARGIAKFVVHESQNIKRGRFC